MKKTLLVFITLFLSVIIGYAETFNINGVTYETLSGSTVNAVGYTISDPTLVLPRTISHPVSGSKYSVVGIASFAFNNKGLTSLTLPSSLLTIGANAFSDNSIPSLVIPNGVTMIDYNAFKNNEISTLNLGTGVASIGLAAFQNNKITSLVLPGSVQTMGNGVFMDNLITNVTVEAGVGNIGINAFLNNPVKSVLSEGTTPPTLATSAFNSNGRDVIDLYIPDGTTDAYVTNSGALWTGFKSVAEASYVIDYITYEVSSTNPNTVSAVNYNVLGGSTVTIPATVTIASVIYDVTEIGEDAFNQKGLSSLTLSEGLTKIGSRAFMGNYLTSLVIPNSVIDIQYNVFIYNQLNTLDLGTGIEVIANGSFGYNNLTNVVIPSSMIAMGGGVFYDNDITTVTVKAGVGQLGFRTFWENPLTTVISESTTPPTITTGGNDETFSPDRSTIDLIIPSGTQGVYVTNSGALWTGFNTVTEDPVLGVSIADFANEIYLYQTTNELNIVSNSSEKLNGYVIYSTVGTTIYQNSTTANTIDISSLASGHYIAVLKYDLGEVAKRFVK